MNRKALLLIVYTTALATLAVAKPTKSPGSITPAQASKYIGKRATVCGKVAGTRYLPRSNGQPTFLNLDEAYPNQIFTIVIWGKDRDKFKTPEDYYRDKNVCVTGKIQSYQGTPEIEATEPTQIQVQRSKK
jgi:hypothetical protein